jgi:GntR family transcriptional regulator, transcriptional repressor for pyruvate dehydrogenase complex
MTRQAPNLAVSRDPGKPTLLEPVRHHRNLMEEVVARIAGEIRSGRLAPGARLPTEQKLMQAMGVSRTVVREAVAALRAEGLVTTRQGSGAFVSADTSRVPFRIDPDGLVSIQHVLDVMELRLAIEVEAAALAAERGTPQTLASVAGALRDMQAAIDRGEGAVGEDFALHRAIAVASGNPRFVELLRYLGGYVIPRQSVRVTVDAPEQQRQYLMRIQKEHARICEAIAARRPADARKAMRVHLTNSLKRYRRLAERQLQLTKEEK